MLDTLIVFFAGFVTGVFTLLGYMLWRMMRNDEWDDSNITNALRLLVHTLLHPVDFVRMFYMTDEELRVFVEVFGTEPRRPFWYLTKDEITEVVKSRP